MKLIPLMNRIALDERTGCWNWKGARDPKGRGTACFNGKVIMAHRLAAHLWLRTPLDSSLKILHRCDNPACFNPKHLFLGTQVDNMQDCVKKGRHNYAKRTHCKNGHLLEGDSFYWERTPTGTRRVCRGCIRENNAKRGKAK